MPSENYGNATMGSTFKNSVLEFHKAKNNNDRGVALHDTISINNNDNPLSMNQYDQLYQTQTHVSSLYLI